MTTSLFQTCLIDRHQIVIMQATEGRRWYTYLPQVRGLMMHSMLCDVCCVICHADDSYYSGAAVVLTTVHHPLLSIIHHPRSSGLPTSDWRACMSYTPLSELTVESDWLYSDRDPTAWPEKYFSVGSSNGWMMIVDG